MVVSLARNGCLFCLWFPVAGAARKSGAVGGYAAVVVVVCGGGSFFRCVDAVAWQKCFGQSWGCAVSGHTIW